MIEFTKKFSVYFDNIKMDLEVISDISYNDDVIKMLINNGHEAMIEFGNITVQFEVDRGVTHELVRHRLASWAQESTRYVNYSKGKFGSEITVINPEGAMIIDGMSEEQRKEMMKIWALAMENAESSYMKAVSSNVKPQIARQVLPNSVKATINMSANYREWRSFFKLRCASDAHPSMRQVSIPLLKYLQQRIPVIFDDIKCAPNTIKINDDGTMDTDVYASIIY